MLIRLFLFHYILHYLISINSVTKKCHLELREGETKKKKNCVETKGCEKKIQSFRKKLPG